MVIIHTMYICVMDVCICRVLSTLVGSGSKRPASLTTNQYNSYINQSLLTLVHVRPPLRNSWAEPCHKLLSRILLRTHTISIALNNFVFAMDRHAYVYICYLPEFCFVLTACIHKHYLSA